MSTVSLKSVTRGKEAKPYKILLYGREGIGKTTFAAKAPSPIILDVEGGTSHLDVARLRVHTFSDLVAALKALGAEPHDYKTVVVDTVDAVEPLIYSHVVEECRAADQKYRNVSSIEDAWGGYGRGYAAAADYWRHILSLCDGLREQQQMHVILLGHATVKKFTDPDSSIEAYDRYELKIQGKSVGILKESVDALLFARLEVLTAEQDGRTKGISTGKRLCHVEPRAAWDAKNRYGLPEPMALDWDAFDAAARKGSVASVDGLVEEIKALALKKAKDTAAKVPAALERAGNDPAKLAALKKWLTDQK